MKLNGFDKLYGHSNPVHAAVADRIGMLLAAHITGRVIAEASIDRIRTIIDVYELGRPRYGGRLIHIVVINDKVTGQCDSTTLPIVLEMCDPEFLDKLTAMVDDLVSNMFIRLLDRILLNKSSESNVRT